jgi:uncharacterized integral membrane protein
VSHDQVEAPATSKADRKERTRRIAALVVGVVIVIFAVVNTDKVKVDWIVTSSSTPLIIVIAVSFVLGLAGGYLLRGRRAKAAALDAQLAHGATISHHHAVGRDHAPWLGQEIGALGVATLQAAKDRLDPGHVMNPGVLGLT